MIGIQTSLQAEVLAVCIVFAVLPTAAFVGRLLARYVDRRPLNASDYTMLGGLIFSHAVIGCNIVATVSGGMGMHIDDLDESAVEIFGKSLLAIQLLWAASLGCVKVSLCLLYIRIFSVRSFRQAAYAIMAFSVMFASMVIIATLAICHPLAFNWNMNVDGSCGNRTALWVAVGTCNIVNDLLILVLPMPFVWRLRTTRVRKVILTLIFGLGFFVTIISIVRLKYLLSVDFEGDLTYTVVNANIWSLLEPALAVTAGCLPTMGPLLHRVRGKTAVASRYTQDSSYGPHGVAGLRDGGENILPLTQTSVVGSADTHTQPRNESRDTIRDEHEKEWPEDLDHVRIDQSWEVRRS